MRRSKRRRKEFESLESRLCLAGVGFATHSLEPLPGDSGRYLPATSLVVDLDGNGSSDLLSADLDTDCTSPESVCGFRLSWFRNLGGDLGFKAGREIGHVSFREALPLERLAALRLDAVNFDRFGDADLMWQLWGQDGLREQGWFRHTVGGSLTPSELPELGPFDVYGDSTFGHTQIAELQDRQIVLHRINDNETYWSARIPNPPTPVTDLVAGKFFPDNDLGFLVGTADETTRIYFDQTANRYVYQTTDVDLGDESLFFKIDGDDRKDLLTVEGVNESASLRWYRQDEEVLFHLQQDIPIGDVFPAIDYLVADAIDIDSDGDLDVTINGTYWMENDGGEFGSPASVLGLLASIAPTHAGAGDIDGDGDIDLFHAGTWYEQRMAGDANGDGKFDAADLVAVFRIGEFEDQIAGNSTFEEGDWNGDGDFDANDLALARESNQFEKPPNKDADASRGFGFAEHVIQDDLRTIFDVRDVDADGDNDLLTRSGAGISWHENVDGKGTFGSPELLTSAVLFGHSADNDGDGDADFFSQRRGGLDWYQNLGGRRGFGLPLGVSFDVPYVHQIAFGDVDGDGDDDAFVLGLDDDDERVALLGTSDGGDEPFEISRLAIESNSSFRRASFADLNGDGDEELIVQDDATRIFDVVGAEVTELAELPVSYNPLGIIDFDGNGTVDIMMGGPDWGTVVVYLNSADGSSFLKGPTFSSDAGGPIGQIIPGDFDGDGDVDWVAQWYDPLSASYRPFHDLHVNVGTDRVESSRLAEHATFFSVDVTGDGNPDILYDDGRGSIILRTGSDDVGVPIVDEDRDVVSNVVVDFNNDGNLDLVIGDYDFGANYAEFRVSWFENLGDGVFGVRQNIGTFSSLRHTAFFTSLNVEVVDLESDGDLDVFVEVHDQYGAHASKWFRNDGDRAFSELKSSSAPHFWPLERFDVDSDGRVDVVGRSAQAAELSWRRRLADGQLGDLTPLMQLPSTPIGILPGDFTGDGNPDYLVWLLDRSTIRMDFNEEAGELQARDTKVKFHPGLRVVDIDGDGWLDLARLKKRPGFRYAGEPVIWYRNESGTFADPEPVLSRDEVFETVDVVDLDEDGDLDFVFDGSDWVYNLGDGFASPISVHQPRGSYHPSNTAFGDIDGDGDLDMFRRGSWFEQRAIGDSNGDGVFDSSDFVAAFRAGKYESDLKGNATFQDGDWNGDGSFDSSDLVAAFQLGTYIR